MKKTAMILLALLLCVMASCALAYDKTAYGAENTPPEILNYLAESRWAGWEVTGWVNPGTYDRDAAEAFITVKSGRKNVLLAFRWDYDRAQYAYAWHNAAALPQVEEPIHLAMYGDAGGQPRFKSFFVHNQEIEEAACFWAQDERGVWNLQQMLVYYLPSLMFIDTSRAGVIHMTNAGWVEGRETNERIYGEYQRDLRYFSFAAFPRTVKEAKEKLTNPPEIPSGTLSAKRVKFTSGKKYKVFSGPGENYGQAGGGKAVVSTNDWIQVFGTENGYAMIQYDISKDKMRIGWIDASALPKKADIPALDYACVTAYTCRSVAATDDPLGSCAQVSVLAEGQEVLRLATMGDWAYIHAWADDGTPVRGFVPAEALRIPQ